MALEQLCLARCRGILLAAISAEQVLADSTCDVSAPEASAQFFLQQADSTGPSSFSNMLSSTPMQVQPLRNFVSKAGCPAVHNVNVDHEQAAHAHGEVVHERDFGLKLSEAVGKALGHAISVPFRDAATSGDCHTTTAAQKHTHRLSQDSK